MTETENREVLEQRMARAIKEAAKDIVSPPRSCPDCAAISNTSEEIRWRMEQVVKAGLQYRDDLGDLAREFNRALEVVKNGDTQGPPD